MRRWLALTAFLVSFGLSCNDNEDTIQRPPDAILPLTQSNITYTADISKIVVTWTTDGPAHGQVYYGTSNPPTNEKAEPVGYKTSHRVAVFPLEPNTRYYLQVQSQNEAGNYSPREPSPADTCRTKVFVDNEPPSVNWVNPQNGSSVKGVINLEAFAGDNSRSIDKVVFSIDGAWVATDTAPPDCPPNVNGSPRYCAQWNSALSAYGNHSLHATAYDMAGHMASHTIVVTSDNTPPYVFWRRPRSGDTIAGIVELDIHVYNEDSHYRTPADSVTFLLDGASFEYGRCYDEQWLHRCILYDCTSLPSGEHTLTAVAYDRMLNRTEASIVVTK